MQIYMHAVILSIARPPCLTQSLNNCSCTGIMPIMTYGGFKRMTGFCKTKIPAEVSEALEAIKDNDEAVKVGFGPPCCAPCCLVIDCVYILIAVQVCSACVATFQHVYCLQVKMMSAFPAGVRHSACDRHVQADFGGGHSWLALIHAQSGAQRNCDTGEP